MSSENGFKIHRLVLTGGPCSGKTTALNRLSQFFESLDWKVFKVPESAGLIIGCGISFYDLNEAQVEQIEEDIIKSIMTLETACLNQAKLWNKPCIVVCDRGCMDCRAYLEEEMWRRILQKCNWNDVDFRDNRYDQVIHLVSSANGAQEFYQLSEIRTEETDLALKLDRLTSNAWIGHPIMNIIDNSTGFDEKIDKLIYCICKQLGIKSGLNFTLRKVKFLVKSLTKDDKEFICFQDFEVHEDFDPQRNQTLKKRGQKNNWFYQMSIGKNVNNSKTATDSVLNGEEYELLLKQMTERISVSYNERCFIWENIYFRLYTYKDEFKNTLVLETETSLSDQQILAKVPPFLQIIKIIDEFDLKFLVNIFKYFGRQ